MLEKKIKNLRYIQMYLFYQDDDSDDVLCIGTPGFGQFKKKREKKKGTDKVS